MVKPAKKIFETPYKQIVAPVALLTDQVITGDFFSEIIDTEHFRSGSLTLRWANVNATNAKVILQVTNDPDNFLWSHWGGNEGSKLIDISNGWQNWELIKFTHRYFRLAFYAGNATAGNLTAKYELRN